MSFQVRVSRLLVPFFLLCTVSGTALAQTPEKATTREHWILSEFGAHLPVAGPGGTDPLYTFDLGMMSRVSESIDVGAGLLFGGESEGGRLGFRPRIRLRTNRQPSIDIAPGVLAGTHLDRDLDGFGFSGLVQLNWNRLSLCVQHEILPLQESYSYFPVETRADETTVGATYFGAKVGGWIDLTP